MGNSHRAVNDYRVLEPAETTDPNGNRAQVSFDPLGHVVGSAVMGKSGEQLGDTLDGFVTTLDPDILAAQLADPAADPLSLLQGASARIVYDLAAYYRTRGQPQPSPVVVWTIERETHLSDLAPGRTTRCRHTLAYSDGSGREIQHKMQAEPGELTAGGGAANPRWVGSGWSIYDNKGRVIRRYEPFFTATPGFEFAAARGVSTVTMYDPPGRTVAVLYPDSSWSKTVYGPWHQERWDRNDTAAVDDPRSDVDVGDWFRRILGDESYLSWSNARITGTIGADQQAAAAAKDAAVKTLAHAGTPTREDHDPLGRPCLISTDFGVSTGGVRSVRNVFDAEGAPLAVIDALGRRVVEYLVREPAPDGSFHYITARDLAGREDFHNHLDSGHKRMLVDIGGHPIRSWDNRGYTVRIRYDAARRPTHRYVSGGDSGGGGAAGVAEILASRTVYGEGMPGRNLCGELYRHYDQAGVSANESCDFKGNLIDRSRRLAVHYRTDPDWSALAVLTGPDDLDAASAALLEPDRFLATGRYDALNRPVQVVPPYPAGGPCSVIATPFNEAGLPERVDIWEQAAAPPAGLLDPDTAGIHAVTNIDYTARGQRLRVSYGNGTLTERVFDPLTERVIRKMSTRGAGFAADARLVQDLSYSYDPSGNITYIREDADIQNTVFFRNQRVEPSAGYTYDAGYRLISATGREHLGQNGVVLSGPVQPGHDDAPRTGLVHPGDGNAMGTYTENYGYDPVGNLLAMIHHVASGGWTRHYDYAEPSAIDAAQTGNRLSATSRPADPAGGPYSERYHYDANGNVVGMAHLSAVSWDEQNQLRSTARQVVGTGTPETTYYVYDAGGIRLRKVTETASPNGPGTRRRERIYLGALELYREYGPDGATVTLARESLFISAGRRPVAVLENRTAGSDPAPAHEIKYQYTSHLSSAVLELDQNSAVISYEEYFPYGSTSYQAVASQLETPKMLRWAGKARDEESGFYYGVARYYAPWLGRWLSPDPDGIADGPNGYEYAHCDPVGVTDPTGTSGVVIGGFTLFELFVGGGAAVSEGTAMWAGAGVITVGGVGIIATSPGFRQRINPDQPIDIPWTPPAPAPPVPVPVPPPPPPAPPRPEPAPPPTAPAPPIPIPVPPIPVPVPVPHAGPRTTPRPDREPDRESRQRRRPKTTDPIPDGRTRRRRPKRLRRYVTYRKTNPRTGRVYVGRAKGWSTEDPRAIVARRDRGHHMSARGYGPARLDKWVDATRPESQRWFDPSYQAIRGREQQLIDSYGGAISDNPRGTTRSGNAIRGVAKWNSMGRTYHNAASAAFGQRHRYTGY